MLSEEEQTREEVRDRIRREKTSRRNTKIVWAVILVLALVIIPAIVGNLDMDSFNRETVGSLVGGLGVLTFLSSAGWILVAMLRKRSSRTAVVLAGVSLGAVMIGIVLAPPPDDPAVTDASGDPVPPPLRRHSDQRPNPGIRSNPSP